MTTDERLTLDEVVEIFMKRRGLTRHKACKVVKKLIEDGELPLYSERGGIVKRMKVVRENGGK